MTNRSVICELFLLVIFASDAARAVEPFSVVAQAPAANKLAAKAGQPVPDPDGAQAADAVMPPGDLTPLLRLETGGPRSYISGLAFSPDGASLYSSGWDKAVQVWNRRADGQFEYSQGATLRVPTGSGLYGGLNALTISADGLWLATAGQGHTREMSGERSVGWVMPAGVMSRTAQFDEGLIYVFNTSTRTTKLLRGHQGPVQSLAFVRGSRSNPPELVSVAEERVDGSNELRPSVRLWDLNSVKELAALTMSPALDGKSWGALPNLQGWRPGLTAWSTGNSSKQVRVALGWGDDQLRVWDAQSGQVANVKSSPNLLAVAPLPGAGNRFLTGAHADVGIWTVPGSNSEPLKSITRQQYQAAQLDSIRAQNLPGALALIPGTGGSAPLAMFVVTKYQPNDQADYRLTITTTSAPVKVVRELELPWRGDIRIPAIAVTNDGKLAAVSGGDTNTIEIYPMADLVAGRNPKPQVLRSRALNLREAGFVRNADHWGIIFNDTASSVPGQFADNAGILDLQDRRAEKADAKWKRAVATIDGWSTTVTKPGELQVRRGNLPPVALQLDERQILSTFAFCPPTESCPVPLIAVATHERGQPLLRIFRGDTGEPIRWCVGHTERIRSLSFSDDGRMLLSVAADRIMSVWTLTDLAERTLNQHGRIPGLTVHQQEERVVVTSAAETLPLKRGDDLVSVDLNQESTSLRWTRDFYQAVLSQKPGSKLPITIRRNGKVEQVTCDIGQAIDETKPLFSLFVTAGEKAGEWDWIGWHPLGNFDSSGESIERLLGWQFNTGDPEHPAKFAAIGDYRDGFYRRDLLKGLIESQKLVIEETEEKPEVSFWLRYSDGEPVRTDYEDNPQVESPAVQVIAEVKGITPRRIRGFTAALDDGVAQSFQQTSEREWIADLSKAKWDRGQHRVTVRLQTPEREITKVERVQYRPAVASIDWSPNWFDDVKEPIVAVNATVIPSAEPVQVQLRVQRPGQAEPIVIRKWDAREKLQINESVGIEPGDNKVEIVAINASAPAKDVEFESTRTSNLVRRATPPQAPRINLTTILVQPAEGDAISLVGDGNTYKIAWPQVQLRGRITGEANLGNANVSLADSKRAMTGFQADAIKDFAFDETVTLKPGSQSILLQAAISDALDEKRLTFVYEPPTPTVSSLTVTADIQRELPKPLKPEPNVFYAGYHDALVTIAATLDGRLDNSYQHTLLINDKPVASESVTVDRTNPKQHRISAKLALLGGVSHVSVQLTNEWNRQPTGKSVDVELRRPPQVLEVQRDDAALNLKPEQLAIRVRSKLPVRTAKVVIDNQDERREFTVTPVKNSADEWLLQSNQFGLTEGEHTLQITAINDEGSSVEPLIHNVRVEKAPSPPPTLAILTPVSPDPAVEQSVTVSVQKLKLEYSVRSTVAASVRLQIRGNPAKFELFEKTVPTDLVPIDGASAIEELDLFEGVNEIELTADNPGGSSQKQIIRVSYVPQTAAVEIASIGDERPRLKNDGTGYFDRGASKSRMLLRGRVHMPVRMPGGQLSARIWVNNFKLPTVNVVIDDKKPNLGWFEADVVFNRKKDNEIRVEVFRAEGRMASELGSTNTLVMDCANPEREQELYVLLLGSGDATQLRDSARVALMEKALRAKPITRQKGSQEIWESDAFSHIHVHDALNAPPAAVQNRLRELVGKMLRNLKGAKGNPQSIVMIYFQGQITLTKDDFAFGTLNPENPLTRAITGRILEENLTRGYGAHLIFLDLKQEDGGLNERDIWPKAPHLGIAVSNWRGPGPQPDEIRMSSVFEKVFPQTKDVRELAEKMDQRYLVARKQFPNEFETVEDLKNLYGVRLGVLD